MAFKGGEEAEKDFGVKMVEVISKTEADYEPNLRRARSRDLEGTSLDRGRPPDLRPRP